MSLFLNEITIHWEKNAVYIYWMINTKSRLILEDMKKEAGIKQSSDHSRPPPPKKKEN
jgi:hypothetical protein